jgi:AhpD family alkylhydroperoxidase
MSKDFVQIAKDVAAGVGMLRQGAPDAMKAFGALSTAATATNAIDTKTKELMALAIGIAVHCDGCVAYHTKMAYQHGATRAEVAETVALAVYMGGGPAAVYGGDALRAYDQSGVESGRGPGNAPGKYADHGDGRANTRCDEYQPGTSGPGLQGADGISLQDRAAARRSSGP